MLKVLSTFEATAIVPANSQGPYTVNAGSPVLLSAGNTHPDATYHWDLGDGATANTADVAHTYADNGVYIAKLTVIVNQPGGATSRHFAIVEAKNVPPVVEVGPDRTVNEGDVVPFIGSFTDVEYPDTHEAVWFWGDYQKPDAGVVSETNSPPRAQGNVAGSHAWGDNGIYSVTLEVRDKDGGVGSDTLTVTVLNVPPTVDAGQDMYAYPCTVITLTGKFTDPGWLDTHIGTWDFGDCTPPVTAVIREHNDSPKGTGVAIASHIYEHCGTYPALCTVVDDDGGVGQDIALIHVVDVENKGFEHGFRKRNAGVVGNGWEPYRAEIPVFGAKPAAELDVSTAPVVFFSEEFPVHGGQRSQRIRFEGESRFGVRQRVGANEGWDYQITAWYSAPEESNGIAKLGLDPTGSTDPTAGTVVWSEGRDRLEWRQLSVRTTATNGGYITIFLEAQGGPRITCDSYFDDVNLIAIQPFCLEEPKQPDGPAPKPDDTCINFYDLQPGAQLPPVYEKDKFTFVAMDKRPQTIVVWGLPAGKCKLHAHAGVVIMLPFPSERVEVQVDSPGPIVAIARNGGGAVEDQATSSPGSGISALVLGGADIVQVDLRGGNGEAVLIEVCARPDSGKRKPTQTSSGKANVGREMEHVRRSTADKHRP